MVENKYKHRLISAPEIINQKRGMLNLGGSIPKVETKINRTFTNRQMIEEFLDEMSEQGWEYKNQILYEGLPNNGCLVFRHKTSKEEDKVLTEERNIAQLAVEYESISSMNAIWRGKKTKGFKEFLRKKGYDLENEFRQKIQTKDI